MRVKGMVTLCSGVDAVAPLVVFQAHHAFTGKEIGIGPAQARGLVRSVIIQNQMMLGGLAGQALVEIHHLLIVAIHEVNLDAGGAPLGVEVQRRIHLLVHRSPVEPQAALSRPSVSRRR